MKEGGAGHLLRMLVVAQFKGLTFCVAVQLLSTVKKMRTVFSAVLLAALASGVWSLPAGPPLNNDAQRGYVCDQLWPQGHGSIDGKSIMLLS